MFSQRLAKWHLTIQYSTKICPIYILTCHRDKKVHYRYSQDPSSCFETWQFELREGMGRILGEIGYCRHIAGAIDKGHASEGAATTTPVALESGSKGATHRGKSTSHRL